MSFVSRLTLAAALAVALGCSALTRMYDALGWLPPTLLAVLVVAATGAGARRARLPVPLVPLVQLAALAALLALLFARSSLGWLLLPTRRTVETLRGLVQQAALDVEQLAAPVPVRPALVLLAVLGVGVVAVVVDLVAVGLQRPAAAGLPLLVLLAVPSGVLPGGLGWLPFTLGAAGWLGLLLVEGDDRVARWGFPLRPGPSAGLPDAGAGRVGRRIGVAALGMAAVVPALVPGLDARLLPGSDGTGDGGRHTTVTYNPITTLQGDLTRPTPLEVLRYRSDDPAPDYLRMTTLDVFDGIAWRSSELQGDRLVDSLPVPVGSTGGPFRVVRTQVDMGEYLRSQWLPVPMTPNQVEVAGTWRWDPASETVYATRTNTRRVRTYSVRSTRVLPDAARLARAGRAPEQLGRYTRPLDVQPTVEAITREAVRSATSRYEQAAALQRFFQGPGFAYDESTAPLNNRDALSAFLQDRRGFCEQYASAMAVMLRVLGIPSRVAVGFTPGRRQSDRSYTVTTDDAHAWPEAWFEGAGWVRFEPTPTQSGRTTLPSYTREQLAGGGPRTPTPGNTPAPETTAAPDAAGNPGRLEREGDAALPDPVALPDSDDALPWAPALLGTLVLALAAAPAVVAALRRRTRWRAAGTFSAWQQLHDDAEDVGHQWRPADSPRAAAAHLCTLRDLPRPAREALERVAAATERDRYARPGGQAPTSGLRDDVRAVRAALLASTSRGRRLRAVLAPPSMLRELGAGSGRVVADLLDRADDVVAAAWRRLRRQAS